MELSKWWYSLEDLESSPLLALCTWQVIPWGRRSISLPLWHGMVRVVTGSPKGHNQPSFLSPMTIMLGDIYWKDLWKNRFMVTVGRGEKVGDLRVALQQHTLPYVKWTLKGICCSVPGTESWCNVMTGAGDGERGGGCFRRRAGGRMYAYDWFMLMYGGYHPNTVIIE